MSVSFLIAALASIILTLVAAETIIAVPVLTLVSARPESAGAAAGAGVLIGAIALALLYWQRARIERLLTAVSQATLRVPAGTWIGSVIVLGALLRLIWALVLPVPPKSDSATYLELARLLATGEPYRIAGTWAYWPPGYPLYLAGWLSLGLSSYAIVVISNLIHHGLAVVMTYKLAGRSVAEGYARLAAALIALWPSLVTAAGIAQKEQLLLWILPACVLAFAWAQDSSGWRFVLRSVMCGALFGFACLVQPSVQLAGGAFVIYALLSRERTLRACFSVLIVAVSALLLISPWTIRNHERLGAYVLITTNGGSNFYRANNPLANGGYAERGEHDLAGYSELEQNAAGYTLGREWIQQHPSDFMKLSVWKQMLFLGDDSAGVYETLRRGRDLGGPIYLLAKGLSTGFWWVAWAVILLGVIVKGRDKLLHPALGASAAVVLYFYLLHSVFESSGKYHVPMTALVAILVASLIAPIRTSSVSPPTRSAGLGSKFVAFCTVGGIATAIQYVILAVLVELAAFRPVIASAIGFVVSAGANYWLNYHLTFAATGPHRTTAARFALVTSVGLMINTAAMAAMTQLGVHYFAAQIAATFLTLLWNFSANLLWSFRAAQHP